MARELTIEIGVESRKAEANLALIEKGIKDLVNQVKKGQISFDQYEKELHEFATAAASAEQHIKELRQEQAKLDQQTKGHTGSTSALTSTLKTYVSGAVIGAAIKATTDWAGSIADLSAKTGISTTMIQKLGIAAGDSGISVDQIAQAIQSMGDKLASGDKSAIAAVKTLGLSLDQLTKSSPDQAFLAIASAVGKIEDPMKRAKLMNDLMRGGLDLTRIANEDFVKSVENATAATEETITALDDMGDSFGRLWTSGKQLLATVLYPMAPILDGIAKAAAYAAQGLGSLMQKIPSGFGAAGALSGVRKAYDVFFGGSGPLPTAPSGQALATGEAYSASALTDTDIALAIKDLGEQAKDTTSRQKRLASASDAAAREIEASAKSWREWNAQLRNQTNWAVKEIGITYGWADWAKAQGGMSTVGTLGPGFSGMSTMTGAMGYGGFVPATAGGFNWGGAGLAGLGAAMPWLSQLVAGGSQAGQVGGTVGGTGGGILGSLFSKSSGLLGSIAPFLGPVMGLVGGLVGKLFGPSAGAIAGKEADQRIGQTQAGLLQQYGSVENIAGMGGAGAALAAAWGSKNVQGEAWFNSLVKSFEEQNALLAEQKTLQEQIAGIEDQRAALAESLIPTYAQIVGLTEKYGISIDGIGTQVAQLGATETFTSILNDMESLFRAGADVGGVLSGMADEISALVQRSISLGTEIPENMRPFIEELQNAGLLLDENGEAIVDLAQLKWGAAVETQADIVTKAMEALDATMASLVSRLEEIVDLLARQIPGAASSASNAIGDVQTPGEWIDTGGAGNVPAMASGGIVTRPTVALIGERGPEAVIPLSRARRASGPTVIQVVMTDGRVLAETVMREWPGLAPAYGV